MAADRIVRPVPPYVSYRTFSTFIDGLRVAMPGRIDRSMMGTMSGARRSQLLAALKYLRLINISGIPTERLAALVNSDGVERQKTLRDVLIPAYSFLFDKSLDLQRSTARQLKERFHKVGASGQTVRKGIAFFVACASDAGIPLSPYIEPTRSGRVGRLRGSRIQGVGIPQNHMQTKTVGASRNDAHTKAEPVPPQPDSIGWLELLLSKFPEFNPTWSDEVKARWFEAFEHLMRMRRQGELIHRPSESASSQSAPQNPSRAADPGRTTLRHG